MNKTGFDALVQYIEKACPTDEPLEKALGHAEEFSLAVPDIATSSLLSTLVAASTGHCAEQSSEKPQVIAITPASAVVGLHILAGLPDNGIVTCIDPEAEHQNNARQIFRESGYAPSRVRYLPSRPLDVMGRLANAAYQVIYADVDAIDLPAIVKAAWPLLSRRGTLVLTGSLLDGTIADDTRTDLDTAAAREADELVSQLDNARVTRLPLGGGLTLVTKL